MATRHFLQWVERQGQCLRRKLNLSPMASLDPYLLAQDMGAQIFSPDDITKLPSSYKDQLLIEDRDSWSAGSIRLSGGRIAIVLNPTHPTTRKRATIMEELSHMHLGHKPSHLEIIQGKMAIRSFMKSQETQAYWVGAAALVPLYALKYARRNKIEPERVARKFGVSLSLITFRERVTGTKIK